MVTREEPTYRHPWLGVEMRHLATLVAVARTRSFRQAAAELGYVQSAVSQHITRLERVVGTRLVERERGRRSVGLTPAGRILCERSVEIIARLRAARTDALACADDQRGGIHVAVGPDVDPSLLAAVLHAAPPGLRVSQLGNDELLTALESGTVDAAIGSEPANPRLAVAPLAEDPFVLLSPGAADLRDDRLVMPAWVRLDAHLRGAGVALERVLRVPVAAAVAPLVAAGAGIGLLPHSQATALPPGLAVLPAPDAIPARRVSLCWHATRRTPALERFTGAVVARRAGAPEPVLLRAA